MVRVLLRRALHDYHHHSANVAQDPIPSDTADGQNPALPIVRNIP